MTKEKAFQLIATYLSIHGREPVLDVVIYSNKENGKISQWTYQGLKKLLLK